MTALLAGGALLAPATWRYGQRLGWDTGRTPVTEPVLAGPVDPVAPMVDGGSASPSVPVTAPPTVTVPAEPVLRLTGPVPARGGGAYTYAPGTGSLLGQSGTPRRYRVAVEEGSGEDAAEFAAKVDATLGDRGSWIGSGRLRLQRVAGSAGHDFTVYLVTRETARRLCAAGGVDIRIGGRPYTSCRAPGKVIINLDRWRLSVDHFVSAGVPLETYRTYVINHEVGHELGHPHERCPGQGRPAPVMMQQTLFLRGCVANPWPYLDGRRYAGPYL